MEAIKKILKNHRRQCIVLIFILTAIAGFLFLNTHGVVYAGFEGYGAQDPLGNTFTTEEAITVDQTENAGDACSLLGFTEDPFNIVLCVLHAILQFVSMLLATAATIFGWVVQVGNMNAVLNAGAGTSGTGGSIIYGLWRDVRDLLNIAFILVLLFSAFATIFQVEKYSYKKLLLNLVLMALLVNFSYPIARFIIDISNVLMYTLIRTLLNEGPGNVFVNIVNDSNLSSLVVPRVASAATLLAAIIFTFILAITLLAVAVMLIVRMVALAILIIFSPIAFVGAILPGAGSSYASKWWDYLFRYAFFGPIMIFMIYIAKSIMDAMRGTLSAFTKVAGAQSIDPNIVGVAAFLSIPIVILWIGMGTAQTMGIAGAATVMGAAQKVSKGAGKKFSGYSWGKRQYDDYQAIRKKEREDALKNKPHFVDRTLARFGDPKAKERIAKKHVSSNKDEIQKASEGHEDKGTPYLVTNINNAITTPPANKQDRIDAAGKVRQALSRGKEFEMELENRINAGASDPAMLAMINKAKGSGSLSAAATPQEIKSWYYAQARKLISGAEQSGVEKWEYKDPNMDTESLYDKTVKHAKSTYEKVRYDASTRS